MEPRIRNIVIGVGALTAASVAGVYVAERHDQNIATTETGAGEDFKLCFKSSVRFWKNVDTQCLDRAELETLQDAPLINWEGEPVEVDLSDPGDASAEPKPSATCRQYKDMTKQGWYAMTSRDMRREAFFVRACSLLDLLEKAQPAKKSYFTDGSPTLEEMQALGPSALLRLARAEAGGDVTVKKTGAAEWRLTSGEQSTILQEIANADFNGDGVEDILIFLYGTTGGTARLAEAALLEKPARRAPVTVSPIAAGS